MQKNYPEWARSHVGKKYSLRDWLEIIVDFFTSEFYVREHEYGRPTKLTKELAINLYMEFSSRGFMAYSLEEFHVNRSTLWRWRRVYRSIHDMHILTTAYVQNQKRSYPDVWKSNRAYQLIVLQRKRGVLSSLREIKIGRPTLYNPEKHSEVESTLEATADKFGVSRRTIINWMHMHPEFKSNILYKRIDWQLPMFEKMIKHFKEEVETNPSLSRIINSSSLAEQDLDNGRNTISSKK